MADLTLNINETLAVQGRLRGAARAVISDLAVATVTTMTDQTFAELLETGGPVGYEPFRNFIAGDHEYEDALFKAVFGAGQGSLPRALSLSVTVDVPDVFDRGSAATLATGVVRVNFTRSFNEPPEVDATLKGGTTVAAPRVSNITAAGFDLELIDPTNARVAGLVSWSAKGY